MPQESAAVDDTKNGRRTMVNLTEEQHEWIRSQAFTEKTSISAIIREAIRQLMDSPRPKSESA